MPITPIHPSGGTANGRGMKVISVASPGAIVHSTSATAGIIDEIAIYAENTDTVTRRLTIEWGGTTSPDDTIVQDIPAGQGLMMVVPQLRLGGAGVALSVRAFASAANVIVVTANINRYTP